MPHSHRSSASLDILSLAISPTWRAAQQWQRKFMQLPGGFSCASTNNTPPLDGRLRIQQPFPFLFVPPLHSIVTSPHHLISSCLTLDSCGAVKRVFPVRYVHARSISPYVETCTQHPQGNPREDASDTPHSLKAVFFERGGPDPESTISKSSGPGPGWSGRRQRLTRRL